MQAFVHTASLKVRGKTRLALAAALFFSTPLRHRIGFITYLRIYHHRKPAIMKRRQLQLLARVMNTGTIITAARQVQIVAKAPPNPTASRKPLRRIRIYPFISP